MSVTPDSPSDLNRRTVLRRAAAAGLLATPAAGFLAACTKDETPSGTDGPGAKSDANPFGAREGKALQVYAFDGGFGAEYTNFNAKAYEAKFKNKVDVKFSKDILTDVQPLFYSSKAPDVINNSSPQTIPVANLIKGEQLRDLTELLNAPSVDDPKVKVRDTLVAGTVESGLQDGKPYTLNYAYSIYGHWYNQTLFEKNGWKAPTTWEEFTALATEAKKQNIYAFTTQGIHVWYIFNVINEWIWKVGGKAATVAIDHLEDGAWKTDAVKTVAERLVEISKSGWLQPGATALDHTTTQQAVVDGKALFIWCGSWLEAEMGKTIGTNKLAVAAPWSLTGSDKAPAGTVHAAPGEGFIVPSKSKNPEGGLEYLRQMLSKPNARKFAELTKSLPVVKGAADGLTASNALASASAVAAKAPEVINWFYEGWYGKPLWETVGGQGIALLAGKITVAQFQENCQKAADGIKKDEKVVKQKRTDV